LTRSKFSLMSNIGFMLRHAWHGHRAVILLCVLIALFSVSNSVIQMFLAPEILRVIESGGSLRSLLSVLAIFGALLLFFGMGLQYLKTSALIGRISVRCDILMDVTRKSTETAYCNLLDTDFLRLNSQAHRFTLGNQQSSEAIWTTLTDLLTNLLGFGIYLFLLSSLDWRLEALIAVLSLAGFFLNRHLSAWRQKHQAERSQYVSALRYAGDLFTRRKYAKDIRFFGVREWVGNLWETNARLFRSFANRDQAHLLIGNLFSLLLTFLRNAAAYWLLTRIVLRGELSVSSFLLYFSAVGGFAAWVEGILNQVFTLHRQSMDLSVIREFLSWPEPYTTDEGEDLPEGPYTIQLNNVSFRYPGAEKDTITSLNLTIRPEEKLAIVGLNGAGKTTLIKLLSGLLDPTSGTVTLNGTDIRRLNRRKYYELFSPVFQQFSVLPASIRENVTQSLDETDEDKLRKSLEIANLRQKIESLPRGADTPLTREVFEDGVEMSGGETQRLMLSRVLYRDSPILLLDEPTAALDPIAENNIYTRYQEIAGGKIAVFISHRLASTRFCDRILYMENGQIAEEGTHDALMDLDGKYAELFHVQSKYYQEGDEGHE